MDINQFFDKIYCINLERRRDRWEQATAQFDRAGITNYHRFSAIESANGWEGCRDSHLAIIREARDRNYDNVLIFEDDVQLARNFRRKFAKALIQVQDTPWDMLYLGGNLHGPQTPVQRSSIWYKVTSVLTTHAYAIGRRVFDKVLAEAPEMEPRSGYLRSRAIDVFYANEIGPHYEVLMAHPMFCIQRDDYSDIERTTMSYRDQIRGIKHPGVLRRLLGSIRQLPGFGR